MKFTASHLLFMAPRFELSATNTLVELVKVSKRVPDGSHKHRKTAAAILFLGQREDVVSPHPLAQYYLKTGEEKGNWHSVDTRDPILIEPGTVHDFEPGGHTLYFLSIQNPALIDPETGEDDFIQVPVDREPYTEEEYPRCESCGAMVALGGDSSTCLNCTITNVLE